MSETPSCLLFPCQLANKETGLAAYSMGRTKWDVGVCGLQSPPSGFRSQHSHCVTCANHLTSLGLSSPLCKVGIGAIFTFYSRCGDWAVTEVSSCWG